MTEEIPEIKMGQVKPEIAGEPARQRYVTEHLANERTYLAFLRTSVGLISFGITINRFSLYLLESQILSPRRMPRFTLVEAERVGFGMVVFGILLMMWAAMHYTRVSYQIDRADYRPNRLMVWVITLGVLLIGAPIVAWLFQR
jgi:putative membrane protein